MRLLRFGASPAAVLLCTAALACNAQARTLEVGPGRAYAKPSAAVAAAAAGDTIRIAPGQYFDCAVLAADNLTVTGTGDAAAVVLTDKTCQGKALLVVTGADVTVRDLTLTRARVPDGNGAGIRAEGGNLTVEGVHFVNNQDGILVADNPAMVLTVRNSQFTRNGACLQACSHAIYAATSQTLLCKTVSSATRARGTT